MYLDIKPYCATMHHKI